MRYTRLKLIVKNCSVVLISVSCVLTLRTYLSASNTELDYEDIQIPSPTLPPHLHHPTSTEFTILGKKQVSRFKMSDYLPGKNSPPLQYSVKTLLTIMNKEFSEDVKNVSDIYNIKTPDFKIGQARKIPFIPGSHHVGDVFPVHHSRHTLILTTWRSGSTFLGDLLNQYPGTFYYFEPLHYYSNSPNTAKKSQDEVAFLESLFKCRFNKDNFGYLQHVATWANTFLFKNHNFRLWQSCQSVLPLNSMCFMPELLSFACKLHPVKMIKTVRLRMERVEPLLRDPSLQLKARIIL